MVARGVQSCGTSSCLICDGVRPKGNSATAEVTAGAQSATRVCLAHACRSTSSSTSASTRTATSASCRAGCRSSRSRRCARRARRVRRAVAAPHAVAAARGRARRRRPAADVLRIRHAERPRRAHRGERLAALAEPRRALALAAAAARRGGGGGLRAAVAGGRLCRRRRGGGGGRGARIGAGARISAGACRAGGQRRRWSSRGWRAAGALPSLPSRPPGDGNAGERAAGRDGHAAA